MLQPLLKEVGRGKRGARDLTFEEAEQAAAAIFGKTASPAQIGAFLMAERIKMESAEELEAFVRVGRKTAKQLTHGGLDCAGPYDGRHSTFYASFATSFVLTTAGLPVTMHSGRSLPPKHGVTIMDLADSAGIQLESLSDQTLSDIARETGLLLVPAEAWCPPLAQLRSIREELGVRTLLNTVEKLLHFGQSPYLIFGVYHNTVFNKLNPLLSKLGYQRSLIVQGAEGSEDLHIHRATRTYLCEGESAELLVIDPEEYGLLAPLQERDWTAALQLQTSEQVLLGNADSSYTNQVVLNAGVRLFVGKKCDTISEGIHLATSLIQNRAAWHAYQSWRACHLQQANIIS